MGDDGHSESILFNLDCKEYTVEVLKTFRYIFIGYADINYDLSTDNWIGSKSYSISYYSNSLRYNFGEGYKVIVIDKQIKDGDFVKVTKNGNNIRYFINGAIATEFTIPDIGVDLIPALSIWNTNEANISFNC